MRCMLKVSFPTDTGNVSAEDGSLARTIESILEDLKPEAAYFCDMRGRRGGYIVCNLKDESEIPAVAEPWFLAFNAQVEIHPVMTMADLKKAAPHFDRIIQKYSMLRKAA